MMSKPSSIQPPRLAAWLVGLFVTGKDTEPVLGDLHEEYYHLASGSGPVAVQNWYWRQALSTVTHLFGIAFRTAPWSTTATVVGGFFLLRFVSGLPDMLLSVVTDRYLTYWSTHFRAYVWMLNAMGIGHLVLRLFVGCVVAFVAKGRELAVTITLALGLGALVGVALAWVGAHRPLDVAWVLWSCADPLAIVAGGVIVRTRRSAVPSLLSRT